MFDDRFCFVTTFNRLLFLPSPVKRSTVDIKNRPRIPIPDEDPYSIAGANMVAATREQLMMQTAGRRGDKPPKLPPRDPSNPYPHDIPKVSSSARRRRHVLPTRNSTTGMGSGRASGT